MRESFIDLGAVTIDTSREARCGFPEFIFGQGKTAAQLAEAVSGVSRAGSNVLATRVAPDIVEAARPSMPDGVYDPIARVFKIIRHPPRPGGFMAVVATAGAADEAPAMEAVHTLEACRVRSRVIRDVGVAGIHRLLARLDILRSADAIIAVAGMEGALPSVLGGLVACPVVAVPSSAGYGASLGGMAALLAMLNSCASGVAVVNVDNGFGAACAVARMAWTAQRPRRRKTSAAGGGRKGE